MSLHLRAVGDGHRSVLLCHGILGSGRNWHGFARQLVRRRPELKVLLVDLRNHGESTGFEPPHTLTACARDLADLELNPDVVMGHSFGGKVALTYARDFGAPEVWVLDSQLGSSDSAEDKSEVSRVIAALRAVPVPLEDRQSLHQHLDLSHQLVQWMTTNLRRGEGGYVWRFDLDAAAEMLADYFQTDFWPLLETSRDPIHVVRAEQSERFVDQETARFEELPPWSPVQLHVLPDSGHWVHVDNPDGLLDIFCDNLGP